MAGVNWFLIICVVAVALMTVALSVYLIIIYQHPEDRNQAWLPKVVVLLGLCVSIYTILLFPLDVANTQSCSLNTPLVNCTFTFPMHAIWQALYIGNMVLVFVVIPLTVFYYEGDSDREPLTRLMFAALWTLIVVAVMAAIIAIPYAVAGYAQYDVQGATSGLLPVYYLSRVNSLDSCIGRYATLGSGTKLYTNTTGLMPFTGLACDAAASGASELFKVRVSIVIYAMSIVATLGWLLFLLFGAIGFVALPLDWIKEFIGRPRSTISRAQYTERARDLARRARDIHQVAQTLKRQQHETGRTRKWRANAAALSKQLEVLEDDEVQLEAVFPQGEDPSYSWTITVLLFWVKLAAGLAALGLTVAWLLQIILYILITPPATPLLNTLFISANNVFPLFGTVLFGIFVFYLQIAVIKGNFRFGVSFLVFRVYAMRVGATTMSSFLFNTALILLASTALIQFAASAFGLYASGTAILDIYGNTLRSLEGISYIYTKNIYIYAFLGVFVLTAVVMLVRAPKEWTRKPRRDAYATS